MTLKSSSSHAVPHVEPECLVLREQFFFRKFQAGLVHLERSRSGWLSSQNWLDNFGNSTRTFDQKPDSTIPTIFCLSS